MSTSIKWLSRFTSQVEENIRVHSRTKVKIAILFFHTIKHIFQHWFLVFLCANIRHKDTKWSSCRFGKIKKWRISFRNWWSSLWNGWNSFESLWRTISNKQCSGPIFVLDVSSFYNYDSFVSALNKWSIIFKGIFFAILKICCEYWVCFRLTNHGKVEILYRDMF